MRISGVRVRTVEVPDEDLIAAEGQRQPSSRSVVTLRMETDQGLEGIGIGFLFGGLTRALGAAMEELAGLTVGADANRIEAIVASLSKHAHTLADSGIFLTALSAIDCALWDLRGKQAGQPLWKLLGGCRDRVPAYASGLLQRDLSYDALARAGERLVEQGFRTVKMHLALPGDPSPQDEVARAVFMREVLGRHVALSCDINERWSVAQAVEIGRRLEEVGFAWIEDPTRHDDYRGLARISAALATPVMAGENGWGLPPFRQMIEAQSVGMLMIDLMHVGGITPWMKAASLAAAFNLPVVSHIMPEFQAQLVAAVPNGFLSEHKSWTWRLFDGCPELRDGQFVLSDRPGHGLGFSKEFAARV